MVKQVKPKIFPGEVDLQMEEVTSFLKENGGSHASHLIYLEDKELYWAQEKKALIVYRRIANKLIVLGDPIGAESYMQAAIKEFCQYSESKRLQPIFYQINPSFMHYYHDLGYRFIKLGEEGVANLVSFSLIGKKNAKLRTSFNKFARLSYSFTVQKPPYSKELVKEMKSISDSWLGSQKEKSFSVGSFQEEYISRFPVALLYDSDGKMHAFATLATDYKKTLSIDLMRKDLDSLPGTMDVLFIHIFKWARDNGYLHCSLGMSPLANVGNNRHAFLSEKLLRLVFEYGNSFYNFKGLNMFKNKFTNIWEPKYLVYNSFWPVTLLQILILINSIPEPRLTVVERMKYYFHKALVSEKDI